MQFCHCQTKPILKPFSATLCTEMAIVRISRSILQKSSSFPRWLSTVTQETPLTERVKKITLRSILSSQPESQTRVSDILNEWTSQGNLVKRFDVINLVDYFRKRKNFRSAIELYDWMESNKLDINNADQAIRIDLLCKAEGLASAEKYFSSLQASEKSNKTYGALLSCYCREKAFDRALEIFEKMKVLNHNSTLNYNNMLSLYFDMEQPEKVVSLVQEMEEKHIAPDIYSYNLLINSYAALKNLDAVEGVLEKMKNSNVKCNLFTYGNLATIYVNNGLNEKANHFLEMMEKMKHQPNEEGFESFRTLLKLYSQMNNLSAVKQAWKSLKSTFSTPNNTCYLFMLLALSKLGDLESLEKVFKEWEVGCSNYDFRLPSVMLKFYLSREMIEEASALIQTSENRGTNSNLRSLNLFTILCIKNHQIDMALKYLEAGIDKATQLNRKWFPADETIQLFLNYFAENKDADRAEKFIQSMKKVNRLDSSVCDSLLLNMTASDVGS